LAAFAQDDEQDVSAPMPTIEEAEKLAQTISGDTNKLKANALEQKLGPG
jgi:hypothetical protein